MKYTRKSAIVLLALVLAGCLFSTTVFANSVTKSNSATVGGVNCYASSTLSAGVLSGSCSAYSSAGTSISQISVSGHCDEYTLDGAYVGQIWSQSSTQYSSSYASISSGSFGTSLIRSYKLFTNHYFNVNGNSWSCSLQSSASPWI